MVIAGELGVGASTLLDQHNVTKVSIKTGVCVKEAVKKAGVIV